MESIAGKGVACGVQRERARRDEVSPPGVIERDVGRDDVAADGAKNAGSNGEVPAQARVPSQHEAAQASELRVLPRPVQVDRDLRQRGCEVASLRVCSAECGFYAGSEEPTSE